MANIPLIGPQGLPIDPLTGMPIDPRVRMLGGQVFGGQPAAEAHAPGQGTVRPGGGGGGWNDSTPGAPEGERAPITPRYGEESALGTTARRVVDAVGRLNDAQTLDLKGMYDYLFMPQQRPQGSAPSRSSYQPAGFFADPVTAPAATTLTGNSRGVRNNNPGNLEDGAFTRSQPGYVGTDGRFARFETPQAGIAAQERLLQNSYLNKGFRTIRSILGKYAPPSDQQPGAFENYIGYVASKTGLGANDTIQTPAQLSAVAAAMREFETGNTHGGGGAADMMGQFSNSYTGSDAEATDQQILRELDAAKVLAQTPSSTVVDSPFVEPPKPGALPQRDFSASDAALERLRPAEILEQDKRKMIRQGIFAGMAQAMASTPDGAGLGKVLAMFGAGALGGNVQGNRDVEDKMEKYDQLMAAFHTAQYNNETNKSDSIWRTATANAQQDNKYAQDRHTEFVKDDGVTMTPDGTVLVRTRTPDGKGFRIDHSTIKELSDVAFTMQRLNFLQGISQHQANGAQVQAQAANGMTARVIEHGIATGDVNPALRAVPGIMVVQQLVANGTYRNLLDEEDLKAIDEGWLPIQAANGYTGEQGQREKNKYIENLLTQMIMRPEYKALWDRMQTQAPMDSAAIATRNYRQQSTTQSRTGTTTRTPGEEF